MSLATKEADLFAAITSGNVDLVRDRTHRGGINVDCRDESGRTLLGSAASYGVTSAVKTLLQIGCDVNQADFYGQTALQYAADGGHLDCLDLLIQHGADVDWSDEDDAGLSALHRAALNGHSQVVQRLVGAKCDVNAKDMNGVFVLHCAVGLGRHGVTAVLLEAGAAVNEAGTSARRTPLNVAAEVADLPIMDMLIRAGARVNTPNDFGMTPLAAACCRNNTEVALDLLRHGAKVNHRDRQGDTALHYSARCGNTPLTDALLQRGGELDVLNENSLSPLHLAVRSLHLEEVQLLIKHGCDVNLRGHAGTALHLAVTASSVGDVEIFSAVLESLVAGGCSLESCYNDFTSETPLTHALKQEKVGVAIALLQHGADPNTDCPFEVTILQKACEKKWLGLIDLLLHCDLSWSRESWLDTDIHTSGINTDLLAGYISHVPTALLHDVSLYRKILGVRRNPRRLLDLCRWVVRGHLQPKLHVKLAQTRLPTTLQKFVMFQIL